MYIASKCLFGPAEAPGAAELNAAELKRIREAYSLRRADRYTALVVGAAVRAAQGVEVAGTGTALVTATAFGPHRTTFATLDDILDYPEDQILPTRFSHSVHNAAASYAGVALQIQGPTLALAGFEDVWFEALELARTLLDGGLCRRALVIGAEERALLTEHAHELWPERFEAEPREGAAALLLSLDPAENRYGELKLDRTAAEGPGLFYFGGSREFFESLERAEAGGVLTLRRREPWRGDGETML